MELYSPFDPSNPRDVRSETARKALVAAFIEVQADLPCKSGEDLQDIAGGLLVGLVCIMAAQIRDSDENHIDLRAGLIELIPWAVDAMRSIKDMPPLSMGH